MTPDVGQSAHFLQIYFHVGTPENSEIDVRLDAFEGENGLDARDKRLIEELQVCQIIYIFYIFVQKKVFFNLGDAAHDKSLCEEI